MAQISTMYSKSARLPKLRDLQELFNAYGPVLGCRGDNIICNETGPFILTIYHSSEVRKRVDENCG